MRIGIISKDAFLPTEHPAYLMDPNKWHVPNREVIWFERYLVRDYVELCGPRIHKMLMDAGATVEHDFVSFRAMKSRRISIIKYADVQRFAEEDDYAAIDRLVELAIINLNPIGEKRRAFRSKQRNILARH